MAPDAAFITGVAGGRDIGRVHQRVENRVGRLREVR
jgi:hypothetical protein